MAGGAPLGNQNAAKGKPWQSAINRALAKRSRVEQTQALDDLAEKFLDAVAQGDIAAFKELGDRLDGKSVQGVEGPGPNGSYTLEITAPWIEAIAKARGWA